MRSSASPLAGGRQARGNDPGGSGAKLPPAKPPPAKLPPERPTPDDIRRFRRHCGLSRAELAQELGITTRAVELWEAGRREPPAFLRLALSALDQRLQPWS